MASVLSATGTSDERPQGEYPQPRPSRKQQLDDPEEEKRRPEGKRAVEELAQVLRLRHAESIAEPGGTAREEVVPRRRVVVAFSLPRELPVVDESPAHRRCARLRRIRRWTDSVNALLVDTTPRTTSSATVSQSAIAFDLRGLAWSVRL